MKTKLKDTAWEGEFLRIVRKRFTDRRGEERVWECVERKNTREIVAVFAVDSAGFAILCRQYRLPQEAFVLEMPAGLTDMAHESAEQAARRELLEETGYVADRLVEIQRGPYNSGLSSDRMVVFYAPNARKASARPATGDSAEDIEVVRIPVAELLEYCLREHADFMVDIKIPAALAVLTHRKLL